MSAHKNYKRQMCIKLQIKMILSVCLVQKLDFVTEQLEQLEAV